MLHTKMVWTKMIKFDLRLQLIIYIYPLGGQIKLGRRGENSSPLTAC